MTFSIRALEKQDIGLYKSVLRCFADVFDEKETYLDNQPDDDYIAGLLESETFVCLAAIVKNSVAGALAAYELKKFEQARSEIYIYDLAVACQYRRCGIATGLINELKVMAKKRGAWVVYVQADYDDPPAIALYEKLGVKEQVLHFDIPID